MKIKVSEASGVALDWLVAQCEEVDVQLANSGSLWRLGGGGHYIPTKVWAQGGPIIEREGINTFKHNKLDPAEPDKWCGHKVVVKGDWRGDPLHVAIAKDGPTPLVAAMRCYVVSKLGEEVEVPEELMK